MLPGETFKRKRIFHPKGEKDPGMTRTPRDVICFREEEKLVTAPLGKSTLH